jgi:PA14 domain
VESSVFNDCARLFSAGRQEVSVMRSLFRTFSLGLICLLLIASSDAAINVYGYRVGRSTVIAQSVGVVSPSANQTPAYSGDLAVASPSNTGHGATIAEASNPGQTILKSCRWSAFQPVRGQITRITLKFDWSASGRVSTDAPSDGDSADAYASFDIFYSTNNGSSFISAISRGEASSIFGPDSEFRPFSGSGSFSVDLPANTPINQIIVADRLYANTRASGAGSSDARVTATVSNVRLEVSVNCFASVPADRWKGEYFNNQTLTGSPAMVLDDGTGFLNLNFGGDSPGSICGLGADYFSARWTRTVNLADGIYRFTAGVDNGVRLYVDGYLRIDQWAELPPNTYTADVFLSAGNHEIRLEFVEYTGGASVSLSWTAVSGANCIASVPANRWRGEYYSNTNLAGSTAMVRDDGDGFINFNFGSGGPSLTCGLGVDYFSARWTRTINFASGVYRFSVTGDDGVRLYVDGQLKIDKWFLQGPTTYTADVALSSAGPHEVKLEYFENGGGAVALLSWTLVTSLSCLPDVPLIGAAPRASGEESIATTAIPGPPKRCGQKNSDHQQ